MTFNPSNALCFGQGFFPPNLVATGHFLEAIDPWLTQADPCMILTTAMHYALVRVFPIKFGSHPGFAKQIDLYVTPADPYMTFEPSNALRSGQGFFPSNLVATRHC